MIVAGEVSGDLHASKLVQALREAETDASFTFFGCAGEKMRAAGVEAVVKGDDLSVVGLPEIARALPMFMRTFATLKRVALERRPDVVILVDFPDFNLKLAKTLSRHGLRIVYYISPQLWAWRRYRVRTIRKYVDLVISILPFEKDWYADHGVEHVEYVGSPLAREVHPTQEKDEFVRSHDLDESKPIVALLPGSRHKEIVRILPVMLDAVALIAASRPEVQFVIPIASDKNLDDVEHALADAKGDRGPLLPVKLLVLRNETFNALNAADVAAVASGTATLETGIIGTPMAIVYKTSVLNYKLLRPLIDVEHFGLINLIAGERIAAELIQDDFSPRSLADELLRLLNADTNRIVRDKLAAAADKLGRGGASRRAAPLILNIIGKES